MKKKPKKSIVLVSSSTGGHAMPILEVQKKLAKKKYNITIFHTGSTIENSLFKDLKNKKIISGKFHRYKKFSNLWQMIKLLLGIAESFMLLVLIKPKLIFSKGGFGSVPVLMAAKLLGIPFFIHESDSHLGLSNKMFIKKAKKIFLSFPINIYSDEFGKNAVYSGLIVREDIAKYKTKKDNKQKIIYITGGSQGAKVVNETIYSLLSKLLKKYRLIHQIGESDFLKIKEQLKSISSKERINYHYFAFSATDAVKALGQADLIISRAGATTMGEIAALKKASILIPYKYASNNHQIKNARYVERASGAIILKEDKLTPDTLYDRIEYLFSNDKNIQMLGKKAHQIINTKGLTIVVEEINNFLEQ